MGRSFRKLFTAADVLLIIILLAVSTFMLVSIKKDISSKVVTINYQNKLVKTISLDNDKIIEIDDGIIVEIKNGKVRVKESTCKHQYCVKQGWNDQLPIVCVPNKLSIVINNKNDEMLMTR